MKKFLVPATIGTKADVCRWGKEDEWHYATGCGEDYEDWAEGLSGFKYCPFCGKMIEVEGGGE